MFSARQLSISSDRDIQPLHNVVISVVKGQSGAIMLSTFVHSSCNNHPSREHTVGILTYMYSNIVSNVPSTVTRILQSDLTLFIRRALLLFVRRQGQEFNFSHSEGIGLVSSVFV